MYFVICTLYFYWAQCIFIICILYFYWAQCIFVICILYFYWAYVFCILYSEIPLPGNLSLWRLCWSEGRVGVEKVMLTMCASSWCSDAGADVDQVHHHLTLVHLVTWSICRQFIFFCQNHTRRAKWSMPSLHIIWPYAWYKQLQDETKAMTVCHGKKFFSSHVHLNSTKPNSYDCVMHISWIHLPTFCPHQSHGQKFHQ